MKKSACLSVLIFCMAFTVVAQSGKQSEQIPVLGWYGVSPKESTAERFEEQKESGITHNFTFYANAGELLIFNWKKQ